MFFSTKWGPLRRNMRMIERDGAGRSAPSFLYLPRKFMPPLPCPLRGAPTRGAALTLAVAFAFAAMAVPSALAQGIEEKAQICSACHGEAGIPQDKATPIIWGQHQGYLYFQLRDYKRGNRKNEQMSTVIETIEPNARLGDYFVERQPRFRALYAALQSSFRD